MSLCGGHSHKYFDFSYPDIAAFWLWPKAWSLHDPCALNRHTRSQQFHGSVIHLNWTPSIGLCVKNESPHHVNPHKELFRQRAPLLFASKVLLFKRRFWRRHTCVNWCGLHLCCGTCSIIPKKALSKVIIITMKQPKVHKATHKFEYDTQEFQSRAFSFFDW